MQMDGKLHVKAVEMVIDNGYKVEIIIHGKLLIHVEITVRKLLTAQLENII